MASHPRRDNDPSLFTSKTPHFFKTILQEAIEDGILGLPRRFVRRYGDQLSSPVKLEVPSGAIWQVELTETDDGRVLLQNGWPEFQEHYSLEFGSFVVFQYEGNDHFHVLIFDKTATEIDYPYPRTEEDDVSAKRKNKEKTDLPCPLPQKRRRTDSSDKAETSSKFEISSSLISLDDPKGVGGISAGRSFKTEVSCCSRKLTATEKAHTIHIANAFKSSGNPLFVVVMRPSHVGDCYKIWIPSDVAREFLAMHKCNLTLCNSTGKTWPAKYYANPKCKSLNAHFYGGWREFVEDNHINIGDICVFELLKHPEMLVKVHINPVVENVSKATRQQARKSTGIRVKSSRLIRDTADCQQTRCPSSSREFKGSKLEKQKKSVEFKGSAKHDYSGASSSRECRKPDHLGKNKMQRLTPTEKRRAADNASWSSSRLVNGKNKEISHLPCPLPRKEMRTDSPNQPGANSKSSRIDLGNLKKVDKSLRNLDDQRTVKTEAFSCVQLYLTPVEKAHAVQIASAFESTGNPFFIVFMQPSYVCNSVLCIPWIFARRFLPMHNCSLTLLDSAGKTWPVNFNRNVNNKFQAQLSAGWRAFVHDNHLVVGDVCVFELIKQHPEILLKVVINRVAKNTSKACKPLALENQQSPGPSSSIKMEDPSVSYIEILDDDSPLNQKSKKKLTSSRFQPCKVMRTNRSGSIEAKGIKLEKQKKSMNSQYLTKEHGGKLKYYAKEDSGRMTGGRRCLKPELMRKIKMEPSTPTEKQKACVGAHGFRTSNPLSVS